MTETAATITTSEIVTTERPTVALADHVYVWPERDASGRVVILRGDPSSSETLFAVGVAGDEPEWLSRWFETLALAIRSFDR